MMSRAAAVAFALAGAVPLVPATAEADETGAVEFRATVYGWLPDVAGRTTFPGSGSASDIRIDASTLLDSLEMTFMGSFAVQRGRWGAFTDVLYLDLADTRSTSRGFAIGGQPLPAGATARASLDLQGWVWTLAGSYRAVDADGSGLDVVGGVRMLDAEQALGWQLEGNVGSIPVGSRQGSAWTSLQVWDAIVGVRGQWSLGDDGRWFVPYYLDLGAGESSLTWQTFAGVGYSFRWGDLTLAWRHLAYETNSDDGVEDVDFDGPLIAASFRW